jgi:Flp pilus assembly protein CpaB
LVAALLAFALAAALLSDRREMVTVAVPTERIAAGEAITADLFDPVELPANTGFANALVTIEHLDDGGLVAARTLQPGEPLTRSAVGEAGGVAGRRVMSVPLEMWQAANGEIEVGDQVDVIEATNDGSRYVLTNAAVVGRFDGGSSGGLVGGARAGDLVILVEVDSAEALDLAAAIEAGTIMVVRSTGAPVSGGSPNVEAGS